MHSRSVAAAAVAQLPIPWAQAATQAAEGGRVWAPAFRARPPVPPIDAAHARTQNTLFTDLMLPPLRVVPHGGRRPSRHVSTSSKGCAASIISAAALLRS